MLLMDLWYEIKFYLSKKNVYICINDNNNKITIVFNKSLN